VGGRVASVGRWVGWVVVVDDDGGRGSFSRKLGKDYLSCQQAV
jgi:hypothetical protein